MYVMVCDGICEREILQTSQAWNLVSACISHSLAFDFISLYSAGRKYSEMTVKEKQSADV